MYSRRDIIGEVKKQLAIDFNCKISDFDRKENIITTSRHNEGRREYIEGVHFYSMVTLGDNAVISADERMHEWLEEYIYGKMGVWLFEHHNLIEIENELKRYGQKLWQSHHMFLPKPKFTDTKVNFELQWFEQEDIQKLYGAGEYSNALCEGFNPKRPDVLAVAAIIDNKIAGLAGCSADTKIMWQIGIDVREEYRSMGIGATLVALLKNEILRRGYIPFYGTSLSNLHSWNIALKCGFYPAWIEIETFGK